MDNEAVEDQESNKQPVVKTAAAHFEMKGRFAFFATTAESSMGGNRTFAAGASRSSMQYPPRYCSERSSVHSDRQLNLKIY